MKKRIQSLAILVFTVIICCGLSSTTIFATAKTTVQITKDDQVVDSFNGIKAKYKKGINNTNTGLYCCAEYVKKYYKNIYKVSVNNLLTGKVPKANNGSFSKTSSPQVGDIGYQLNGDNKGHWFIIKEVNGKGNYTIIEQNWKWKSGGKTFCYKNRNVSTSTKGFKAFRWSKKPNSKPDGVKSAPKNLKLTKSKYGDSINISWSKVANATNYWVIVERDGKRIVDKNAGNVSSVTIATAGAGKYVAKVNGYIPSKSNGPKSTRSITISSPSGSTTVSNGTYHIVSALDSNQALNVKSLSTANGANIQTWNSLTDSRQTFGLTYLSNGTYKIKNTNSGKYLDIQSGGLKYATNVQQWQYNGVNQQWVIKPAGNDSFYIISKRNGHYLDVKDGKAGNGSNVWTYYGNGSAAQKWKFVAYGGNSAQTIKNGTYHIVSALDNTKNLNVKDTATYNGANIQLWATLHDPKHKFNVTYLGNGYYKIINTNSGKSLDVASASVKSGANVHQWEYKGANQQQWILKSAGNGYYYIIAKNSGLYLDAAGGKSANGTNVQMYLGNYSNAQKWKFVR